MNKYHKQAESIVRQVIGELQKLLPDDVGDISNCSIYPMDDCIKGLVNVKVLMACANESEGRDIHGCLLHAEPFVQEK